MDDALRQCLADIMVPPTGPVRVLAVPRAKAPRAYVSAAPALAATRLVRHQYGGGSLKRRLQTGVLTGLAASGIAARVSPWRVSDWRAPDARVFHDWVRGVLSRDVRVGAVLIGPPRANRKPVVLLTDRRGELVAVVKVGWDAVTAPLVRQEATALAEVERAVGSKVHVPRLVATTQWGAVEAMMMAPLPRLDRTRAVERSVLVDTVRRVAGAQVVRAPLDVGHDRMAPLVTAARHIDARTSAVVHGSSHGDLHAGNLGVARDGMPVLWDWERWRSGLPVGFDLLHHDVQRWVTADGLAPRQAADRLLRTAPAILEPLGITAPLAPVVAADYLIRLAARYVEDGQDEAGSRLGAVENWIFPAIMDWYREQEHR
ncbi:hypothetical protein [Microbacterium sp. bgisy189]|uniref:hypothetical protein n=1 Tax=Microbacterium sp. bgisy189 TaxID=3413798 RepID=UPI003EB7D621